ncbi:MAG: hypothetical protein FJZ96_08665 [Chloroflexi bacterium]|nr:hypothetical protein [Chloroflexota bacterium]
MCSIFRKCLMFALGLVLSSCSLRWIGVQRIGSMWGNATTPIWSPDGTKIVMSSYFFSDNETEIRIVDLETGSNTLLISLEGDFRAMDWSPDGEGLLFSSEGNPSGGVDTPNGFWTMKISEPYEFQVLLSDDAGSQGIFLPEGEHLIIYSCQFNSDPSQDEMTIYKFFLQTGEKKVLYSQKTSCSNSASLAISPDGQILAFSHAYDWKSEDIGFTYSEIFLLDILSGQASNITEKNAAGPSWSPDSRFIAYTQVAENGNHSSVVQCLHNPQLRVETSKFGGQIAWSPIDENVLAITELGNLYLLDIPRFWGEEYSALSECE